MKKRVIVSISIATVLMITSMAFAWQHGQGRGDCPRFDRQMLNDLSQPQRDALMALRQNFIDESYKDRNTMMQKRNEMRLLMQTSSPDRAELNKMMDEINTVQRRLMDKRMDFILAAKKIAPEITLGMGDGECGRGKGHSNGHAMKRGNCTQGYNN